MWSNLVLYPPKVMVFCWISNHHISNMLCRSSTLNYPLHPNLVSISHRINKQQHTMHKGFTEDSSTEYEEALNCLSSLITKKTRGDGSNRGDKFDIMFDYLKILELEEPISKLSVIHVAGTKGKGSTCAFTESILRNCGLRTGLFTSPHLIDIRERFRINGVEISKEKFLVYFWWCWNKLQEKVKDVPMPTYFRFLALLGFKIFCAEKVDVAILEVGLGGKYDATNVVKAPVVCGITSLGYDHMEILGNTLGEIAGEKAGIFKQGVPAVTVPQKEEAMSVLKDKASQLGIPLQVASPLNKESLSGQKLGLSGEHQFLNAALAVSLSSIWLQKVGHDNLVYSNKTTLADQFIKGLTTVNFEGRAQVVFDPITPKDSLVFYLDGAHSPESLDACARWFSRAVKDETQSHNSRQILLFNCMSVRDPQLLLPPLVNVCTCHSIHFDKALFVPNQSVYNKVGSYATPQNETPQVDLSWQLALQRVYENLAHGDNGKRLEESNIMKNSEGSSVFSSLPQAIQWLRENAMQNRSVRFQVLVTGSLHLVGDVLKLIKK